MTGPRTTHPEFEELLSASLTGELSDAERRRLDAHLDVCDACRGALAAFADGRRIVAGLRHIPVPRDLHARVRTGIEQGRFAALPWWRRPAVLFAGIGGGLAAVAGALLALVILNQPSAPVGNATPTPTPSVVAASATPTPTGTFPSGPTPMPMPTAATPVASPSEPAATPAPDPSVTPSPEPDVVLALTGPADNRALTAREGPGGEELIEELDTPPGEPIAAELSPDGQWIAYLTRVGEKGTHEVRVSRIGEAVASDDPDAPEPIDSPVEIGETRVLGESVSGDPFVEHMAWSHPSSRYLAFTMVDPESGDTDAWIFDAAAGDAYPLTDTGDAYAGSWIPDGGDASVLWISQAGQSPVSHAVAVPAADAEQPEPIDPQADAISSAEGIFQPLLNAAGRFAIYWRGAMDRIGPEDGSFSAWQFMAGAQPYLAEHVWESEEISFDLESERSLFTDLTVGREAFTSANISWGEDGIAYAVWNVRWTGSVQSGHDEDPYPDATRVYFSHATDPRGLTRFHAIDRDDVPEDWNVVDVKVSPTGEHLVITAARPRAGVLDPATAELLLVERNTGSEADVVRPLAAEEGFWFGPAAFDRRQDDGDGR